MSPCPVLQPNSFAIVDGNGNPVTTVRVDNAINVCTYFPQQAGWTIAVYDTITGTVFFTRIGSNPTGDFTALLPLNVFGIIPGTYILKAAVCQGTWTGNSCSSGAVESTNTITLTVTDTVPPIPNIPIPASTTVPQATCPFLQPNSIAITDYNGNPITTAGQYDTFNACTFFPYQGWWNLLIYDDTTKTILASSRTNDPAGNTTVLGYLNPGTYNIKAAVCYGSWTNTTCSNVVESTNSVPITITACTDTTWTCIPNTCSEKSNCGNTRTNSNCCPPTACYQMPANTISILKNGVPVQNINPGDTVTVKAYFPDYASMEWKVFDTSGAKLTSTVLMLDNNGCGNTDITFNTAGRYNIFSQVCSLWAGDTCTGLSSANTPPVKLYVGTTETAYWHRIKEYPKNKSYIGYAVRETMDIGVPILSVDEGYNGIIAIIEQAATISGRTLLNLKVDISDKGSYYDYVITTEYAKPAGTTVKTQSLQVPLVPLFEVIILNFKAILAIIGGIVATAFLTALYFVLIASKEFFKYPASLAIVAGAGLLGYTMYLDKRK